MSSIRAVLKRSRRQLGSNPNRRRHIRQRWMVGDIELLEPRHVLSPTLMISEFMASNDSTLADGDGIYSDWIEVHNPTTAAVQLDGWYLTDDSGNLDKWPFPDIVLGPNAYLVVFASAPDDGMGGVLSDYVDQGGYVHTNFKLSADGEYLGLAVSDGMGGQTVVHDYGPEYPEQTADVSYGVSQTIQTVSLVSPSATAAAALVPGNGLLDAPSPGEAPPWTLASFDDSSWGTSDPDGGTGVGFDAGDDTAPPIPDGGILEGGPLGHDLTDPENDGILAGTITVGNPNSPANEEPHRALDNTTSTKWLSFAPAGTFYQFHFNTGPQLVTGYTITSANDSPNRDPYSWTLRGSNNGTNFTILDTRSAQDFAGRFETHWYSFQSSASYEYYRFDFQTEFGVTGNNEPVAIQMAEIELFSEFIPNSETLLDGLVGHDLTDPENDGILAGTYSVGNPNSPVNEEPHRALDNTTSTKWLSFAPAGTYYQFQFSGGPQLVNAYTITSANDEPNRDPYSWTLSGSDDGIHFTVLDTRSAENFANRFETHRYVFSNSTPYEYYRFDFQTEYGVNGTNQPVAIQMAEIELLSDGQIDYENWIDIDIEADWNTRQTSFFERIEFPVDDPSDFSALLLKMQYDDGFVAWLNGSRVAGSNAPDWTVYDSKATAQRANQEAVIAESFDITEHLDKLVAGTNVLAIQGLNVGADSADLLIRPELIATEIVDPEYVPWYYLNPSPSAANSVGLIGFVAIPEFSAERGFYDAAFSLAITTQTPGADIYYTTNGDEPMPSSGTFYTGSINIGETTSLRAAAFKDGYISSKTGTHTYIFIDDVVRQDYQATSDAGFPTSWGGYTPDYGIDPDVIGTFDASGNSTGGDLFGGIYAATIKDDLTAIPTLSIVMNIDDMFGANGIYTNSTASGVAWERPTSVELIYADGTEGFQVDAGIRIHGGAFRRDDLSKKHSLRLVFKDIYGSSKLNFPLFGIGGVDQFDTITFRMDSNDGWAWSDAGNQPQYARDEFARRTQLALGQPAAHGSRVHVYINGIYWGMYNPVERPDASFSASYYGGDKSEWDALNSGTILDGNDVAWNTLRSLAQNVADATTETARTSAYMYLQGKNPDGSDHPTAENYLDVDNYIDYLIVNFYTGNVDWPHRNWFTSRQRGPESTGFKFHIWDAEATLGLFGSNINTNRIGASDGAAEPYNDLRSSAEFRLRFADRVQQALFNDGALTAANAVARYQQILSEIDQAIVAESARWGDMHTSAPHTKAEWETESIRVINTFLTGRTNIFLNQLRSAGLYPSVNAPTFNQRGGQVASGFDAVMVNPNGSGTIYYTTDGSDPRLVGGMVSGSATAYAEPIPINSATTIKARVFNGAAWSAIDEAAFTVAPLADATNLRITEINYNPHNANLVPGLGELAVDNNEFEFVELCNIGSQTIDLSGTQFIEVPDGGNNEGIVYTFGQQTLAPNEYVLIVKNQAAFESRFGLGLNIAGEYTGKLASSGELLTLWAADGSIIQQFEYNDTWSSRTDGQGSSLVVIDSHGDYSAASNWRASAAFGGTPGSAEIERVDVMINEVLAHTDLPDMDAIELYNSSDSTMDLSGWWLSDASTDYFKYQFAPGSSLGPGSYLVLDENDFNSGGGTSPKDFALDSTGDDVWLLESDATGKPIRFADVVSFDATLNGITLGRIPNGSDAQELFPLAQNSLGLQNGPHLPGPIIISEVHYHPSAPPSGSSITEGQLEFVELYHRSENAIILNDGILGGWRLRGGIDFDFITLPIGTALTPGSILVVVAFDPSNVLLANEFRSIHGIGTDVVLIGPFSGQLDNGGEAVRLLAPTVPPLGELDAVHYLVDRITYDDIAPWPIEPDGGGDSLNRGLAGTFGDAAASWRPATPTPGSVMFEYPSPGDFDTDGDVDRNDLNIWESGFGTTAGARWSEGDSDEDGDVDGFDFLIWQQHYSGTASVGLAADGMAGMGGDASLGETIPAADPSDVPSIEPSSQDPTRSIGQHGPMRPEGRSRWLFVPMDSACRSFSQSKSLTQGSFNDRSGLPPYQYQSLEAPRQSQLDAYASAVDTVLSLPDEWALGRNRRRLS
ncbi:MAG: lamin tail domain-containing protein [Pirellulales bacterium]|nr:lamin tail domain-containing protein [Pirellulales bacterium]